VEGSIHESSKQIEQLKMRLRRASELSPEALKQQIADLESKFNEKAVLANELSSKFTVSSSSIGGTETRANMISERLEKMLQELEGKRKVREELRKLNLPELSKLVEELQGKLRSATDELAACRARIKDLYQTTSELAEAGSTCPVCDSPLDERKKQQLLEQKRGQLESSRELESQLESRVKEFDEELRQKLQSRDKAQALTREAEDLPALEAEYSEFSKELERLKRELEEERKELEKMKGELERVNQEVQKLRDDFTSAKQTLQLRLDLERMEEDNRKKLAERLKLQRELEEVKSSYEKIRVTELRDRHEKLIQEQGHLQARCAGIEQLILEKQKAVKSIRERQAFIRRREVEIKNLQGAVSAMGVIQTAFIRTQLALREQFIEGVNGAMEELWSCIYPYGDFNGIRLAVIKERRSGDYVLQLRDRRGNWIPVDGVASGGERTDACLTLRIAFAVVLAPALRWIILDEPTHNLDVEGIQELARVLRERLPEVVKQVIVITHEERLEAAVSGYLYKFSRDKNKDEPTQVEQATAPELISETP
jgi:DNA repair exonuclease SbcCD ATPase subunit